VKPDGGGGDDAADAAAKTTSSEETEPSAAPAAVSAVPEVQVSEPASANTSETPPPTQPITQVKN